jgi:translation elongation factor EF-1alpha
MSSIDDLMADDEESRSGATNYKPVSDEPLHNMSDNDETETVVENSDSKVQIGVVDRFFSKVSVAAIRLTGELNIGDNIEIGDGPDAVNLIVTSMQIDRKDIENATKGDDIGVKVESEVKAGAPVYKINT